MRLRPRSKNRTWIWEAYLIDSRLFINDSPIYKSSSIPSLVLRIIIMENSEQPDNIQEL